MLFTNQTRLSRGDISGQARTQTGRTGKMSVRIVAGLKDQIKASELVYPWIVMFGQNAGFAIIEAATFGAARFRSACAHMLIVFR